MNDNLRKANKVRMETLIEQFARRGIKGYYCENAAQACDLALSFIKDGDKVACGGSMTIGEIGLKERFAERNAELIDPNACKDPEEAFSKRVATLATDVYFMSSNAITMDGKLVNIDGTGNRVAALCYGPKQVVVIAGYNKLVETEDQAISRIKNDAVPANCIRLNKNTPCAITGKCGNCLSMGNTVCSMTVTTRFCSTGRINVILVNENLGY